MSFYWVKTNRLIKMIFHGFVWQAPNPEKMVYLTFDDGPTPGVTEWVLNVLGQYGIKATFFCIGNNIRNNPAIFQKVINAGHTIGNHTYNHLNGWKTDNSTYLANVDAAEKTIAEHYPVQRLNKLFRPPYGRIKSSQARQVRQRGYQIIMWDVLSADFDRDISPDGCLRNVIDNARAGSIIIFHDSIKASSNMMYALPKAIEYLKGKGYKFGTLS